MQIEDLAGKHQPDDLPLAVAKYPLPAHEALQKDVDIARLFALGNDFVVGGIRPPDRKDVGDRRFVFRGEVAELSQLIKY